MSPLINSSQRQGLRSSILQEFDGDVSCQNEVKTCAERSVIVIERIVGGDALSKEGLFSRAFWDVWVRMLVNSIHGVHMLGRRDADVQCETATREDEASRRTMGETSRRYCWWINNQQDEPRRTKEGGRWTSELYIQLSVIFYGLRRWGPPFLKRGCMWGYFCNDD